MSSIHEFLEVATKILPNFDGKFENLQQFLDALSIVDSIKDRHESLAVELIKIKLIGHNLMTTETTVKEIINTLKAKIKEESVDTLISRLMNLKQYRNSAKVYGNQVLIIAQKLKQAYLADGVPVDAAEKYSKDMAVRAMIMNTSEEGAQLILMTGNSETLEEAVNKFLNFYPKLTF